MIIEKDNTALQESFPFMVYDSKVEPEGKRNYEKVYHWHDFLEITYVKKGMGRYFVSGNIYEMKPKDIIIFNNSELHAWEAYEGQAMEVMVVIFSPALLWSGEKYLSNYDYIKPFYNMNTNFDNRLDLNNEYTNNIYEFLLTIEEEYKNKPEGYRLMIKAKLLETMTYLVRYFQDNKKTVEVIKEKEKSLKRLEKVLNFINTNYTNQITLQDLSKLAGMNPNYFSTFFNSTMGFSFTQYISTLRINRAEFLVNSSELPFIEIAFECGFNSLSNFNRVFKLERGIAPSELRRNR